MPDFGGLAKALNRHEPVAETDEQRTLPPVFPFPPVFPQPTTLTLERPQVNTANSSPPRTALSPSSPTPVERSPVALSPREFSSNERWNGSERRQKQRRRSG